jgi:type IV pilus assembly protein PilE
MDTKMQFRRERGFTLIELMITVVIIGILTAIAYPSYQEYVRRGNRAEARSILLEDVQILERNYTTANRHDAINSDGSGGAPVIITQSPKTGTAKYNIAVNTASQIAGACATAGQCYMLTATPTGNMAGDNCGNLRIDDSGARDATGALGTAACWER